MKKRILFVRRFRRPSGGQIKVRDYFLHSLAHPELEPYIYFTPDSRFYRGNLWDDIPPERIVTNLELQKFDCLFLAGKDWSYLPSMLPDIPVINLVQHVRHGDPDNPRFPFLARPAMRICVTREVHEAISLHMKGDAVVIEYGIPFDLFSANGTVKRHPVLILALKNEPLGKRLYQALKGRGVSTVFISKPVPRPDFARFVNESDIFVGLPNKTEGFYLPALEAMASKCAVVCSDAIGNRGFCKHGETALMPQYDDFNSHLTMIERLLENEALRDSLRESGFQLSRKYTLEAERENYFKLLGHYLFKER